VVEGEEQNRREIDNPHAPIRALTIVTTAIGNKATNKKGKENPIATHKANALKRGPATIAVKKGTKHANVGNEFTTKNKSLNHHRQTTHNILPSMKLR
jgi:hypothetical protein